MRRHSYFWQCTRTHHCRQPWPRSDRVYRQCEWRICHRSPAVYSWSNRLGAVARQTWHNVLSPSRPQPLSSPWLVDPEFLAARLRKKKRSENNLTGSLLEYSKVILVYPRHWGKSSSTRSRACWWCCMRTRSYPWVWHCLFAAPCCWARSWDWRSTFWSRVCGHCSTSRRDWALVGHPRHTQIARPQRHPRSGPRVSLSSRAPTRSLLTWRPMPCQVLFKHKDNFNQKSLSILLNKIVSLYHCCRGIHMCPCRRIEPVWWPFLGPLSRLSSGRRWATVPQFFATKPGALVDHQKYTSVAFPIPIRTLDSAQRSTVSRVPYSWGSLEQIWFFMLKNASLFLTYALLLIQLTFFDFQHCQLALIEKQKPPAVRIARIGALIFFVLVLHIENVQFAVVVLCYSGRHGYGAELISVVIADNRPVNVGIGHASGRRTIQNHPVATSGSYHFRSRRVGKLGELGHPKTRGDR